MTTAAAATRSGLERFNRMYPLHWIPEGTEAILDVGCNSGGLLCHCRDLFPEARLAGVEIDPRTFDLARAALPEADLHRVGAEALPFESGRFDCVTCIEVLEHVPPDLRARALSEMRRVLRPGGRLILRVPHAGVFGWLDPNNYRFRFRGLHQALVGRGLRDAGYATGESGVVWHHHFTQAELLDLLGEGWKLETVRRGGLVLLPLLDAASWPFYRLGLANSAPRRAMHRLADFDLGLDYGRASYDILLILQKTAPVEPG